MYTYLEGFPFVGKKFIRITCLSSLKFGTLKYFDSGPSSIQNLHEVTQ